MNRLLVTVVFFGLGVLAPWATIGRIRVVGPAVAILLRRRLPIVLHRLERRPAEAGRELCPRLTAAHHSSGFPANGSDASYTPSGTTVFRGVSGRPPPRTGQALVAGDTWRCGAGTEPVGAQLPEAAEGKLRALGITVGR